VQKIGVILKKQNTYFRRDYLHQGGFLAALLINNLISTGAYLVSFLLIPPIWMIPNFAGEGALLFPAMLLTTIVLLVAFVAVGYLLIPLPKFNFLSVLGLLIFLVAVHEFLNFLIPLSLGNFLTDTFSNSALGVIVNMLFIYAGDPNANALSFFALSFVAAFSPPALTYLGIHLKMWRKNNNSNMASANDKEWYSPQQ